MATSSITKNFVISGEEQAKRFIEAIEASAKNRPVRTPVAYHEIKGKEELSKFMEAWEKNNASK